MSKFVDEIIKNIKESAHSWTNLALSGIETTDVTISNWGNSALLSTISVEICDKHVYTSYIDKWRLEKAITRWFKNIDLQHLKQQL